MAKRMETEGGDILLRLKMAEMNALLEDYEARCRFRRCMGWAVAIMVPLWGLVWLATWAWLRWGWVLWLR